MPRIELTTEVPAAPERCFELSLSADAHQSSMSDSGERAVSGVTSGVMRRGDSVTWKAHQFESPVGPVGRWVNALVLTRYMTKLLKQRNAWLVDALSAPDA